MAKGKVSTIDLAASSRPASGRGTSCTMIGLNVSFAKLATRASIGAHLGRLTYVAAELAALREHPTVECDLRYSAAASTSRSRSCRSSNAPIFGGALGMRVGGVDLDDGLLDVVAFEALPLHRIALAALFLLLHSNFKVHTHRPLDVAVDGEVTGTVPGDFEVAGEALRVVTSLDFQDVDD